MIFQNIRIKRGHARPGHLTRAFTLIELLVVIAIIGILSAVILASLNTARAKGVDAAIKSDLNTIQTEEAIDYDSNGGQYGNASLTFTSSGAVWTTAGTCAAGSGSATSPCGISSTAGSLDTSIGNALVQASNGSQKLQVGVVNGATPSYVVEAPLTATSGTYWCVDSTGVAKGETAALSTSATSCP